MRATRALLTVAACAFVLATRGVAQEKPPATAPAPLTVVRAARVIDVASGDVLRNQQVIVEGTLIKAIGPGAGIPAGATLIDLGDVTLMPGLIDGHTHITGQAGDYYEQG